MKPTSQIIIFILTIFTVMANAYAQSSREQLNQLVEQLQKSPTDNALREKIIKLAQTVKPTPAVPEEAQRREGRAKFAFKSAKSIDDYLSAAREYEEAVRVAPWIPGYYLDLCTIYEKAEKYGDAKRNCEISMLGLSDPAQVSEVRQRIAGLEFGIEKANSPQAREERRKAEERLRPSVEGEWSQVTETSPGMGFRVGREGERFVISSYKFGGRPTSIWYARNALVDQQVVRFTVEFTDTCESCRTIFDLSLSASGTELTGTWSQPPHTAKQNAKFTRVP